MGNENSQQVRYGQRLENNVEVEWLKHGNVGSFPGRDGHCACAVGHNLYVFGGVVHPQGTQGDVVESNEMLTFNVENQKWARVDVSGSLPAPRSAATMANVGKSLYLFGGLSREVGWFDAVHRFDTDTSTWSCLETEGSAPSPRDKLASTVIGDKIYIFGGFGPQGMLDAELDMSDEEEEEDDGAQFGWFNDLFIFDTASRTWSNPMQMNLGVPTPRAAHGMCSVGKYIVIFGGRDADARQCDLHIFDTESRKWQTDLVVQGCQPEPRSFHSLTTVGSRVLVIGGRGIDDQDFNDMHIFDTDKRLWLQPKLSGSPPAGRGLHTATVVQNRLVVYGGSGAYSKETLQCTQYYSDTYSASVDAFTTGNVLADINTVENQENISAIANVDKSEGSGKSKGLAVAQNLANGLENS